MKVSLMTLVTLCLFMVVSCIKVVPPPKYEGPQTVEALLETFGEKVGKNHIDEKYPQAEWLQMLLDKGVTIEHFGDYSAYMSNRWSLAHLENQPEQWVSGQLGIPPTDDWETYKNAYVDRKIWERQQLKAARQTDPQVHHVLFLGPNADTIIPVSGKHLVVHRTSGGASFTGSRFSDQQKFDLLFKGKHPWGWKVIYVDAADNILDEKPAPISREDLGMPEDVPWPPKNQEHLDRIYDEVRHRKILEDNR